MFNPFKADRDCEDAFGGMIEGSIIGAKIGYVVVLILVGAVMLCWKIVAFGVKGLLHVWRCYRAGAAMAVSQ